jgi:hypothetical protein
MMTLAGSQRKLADFTGLSHQQIGRILRIGEPEGGLKHQPTNPALLSAIDNAFAIHTEIARDQAKVDRLHFNADLPVYTARLWHQAKQKHVDPTTGEITIRRVYDDKGRPVMQPGERVSIEHTHWLSDKLRTAIVAKAQKSGKYLHASVGSLVNLRIYNSRADKEWRKKRRTPLQEKYRKQIQRRIKLGQEKAWVFTKYVPTPASAASDLVNYELAQALREKHEPATGEPGTHLAAQILLQTHHDKPPVKATGKGRTKRLSRKT